MTQFKVMHGETGLAVAVTSYVESREAPKDWVAKGTKHAESKMDLAAKAKEGGIKEFTAAGAMRL